MVNKHFSLACHFCRSQHTRCDLTKPECLRCTNRGLKCPGYRDVNGFLFIDQSAKTATRSKKKSQSGPSTQQPTENDAANSTMSIRTLGPDQATKSVNFFFTSYILDGRNPLTSSGHFDFLLLFYTQASPSSLIALASDVLAQRAFASAFNLPFDSPSQANSVVRAAQAMRAAVSDPLQVTADETLMAALLLDFGDMIMSRRLEQPPSSIHHHASVNLLRLRGPELNFASDVSRSLLYASRSNALRQVMSGAATAEELDAVCSVAEWDLKGANPAVELDKLLAYAIFLHNRRRQLRQMHAQTAEEELRALGKSVQSLMSHLENWQQRIPAEWHPQPQRMVNVVPELENSNLLPDQMCEVFPTLDVAYTYDQWRCARLLAAGLTEETGDRHANDMIQEIIATVPAFLFGGDLLKADSKPRYSGLGPWWLLSVLDILLWICNDNDLCLGLDKAKIGALEVLRAQLLEKSKLSICPERMIGP